jgi:hypothetical protein
MCMTLIMRYLGFVGFCNVLYSDSCVTSVCEFCGEEEGRSLDLAESMMSTARIGL